MRKLLLLLIPLALFAQVKVDTVIRLPSLLQDGYFMPELNKLCVQGESVYYMLDCSTYQLRSQIPRSWWVGLCCYSWNWRRQKLYVTCNPFPDSTLVIDAAADSAIGWLWVANQGFKHTYVSDGDRLYQSAGETLFVYDCAADTVMLRILPPVPGYRLDYASWDSVGRKLFVAVGEWSMPQLSGVYDYVADSFVKILDVSSVNSWHPDALVFVSRHKAYIGPYQPEPRLAGLGIIDTERDTLTGLLPVSIGFGLHQQVAVNERDGKVYVANTDGDPDTPDTLWVIDCATDSVLKRIEYKRRGYGAHRVRWIPWSNRIYLSCYVDVDDQTLDSSLVVLDCRTDSIIEPGLQLGRWSAADILLDPVRERIFAIGADSGTIHVLRDVGYGVAESPTAGPQLASGLQVQMTSGGYVLRYSVATPCRVDLSVYDLMGREVRQLVAGQQPAGQHDAIWNGRDRNGAAVARGVYFVRLDTPGFSDVKKAVVTR